MVAQTEIDLANELARFLRAKNWTCATVESCTGGGIGYAMTSVPGSSDWFAGGLITYSNQLKQQLAGVDTSVLEQWGAVSAQTAEAMARGGLNTTGADVAIAVTGVAGPGGGTTEKPVGLVWFGLAWQNHCISWPKQFAGDRAAIRQATVLEALKFFQKFS